MVWHQIWQYCGPTPLKTPLNMAILRTDPFSFSRPLFQSLIQATSNVSKQRPLPGFYFIAEPIRHATPGEAFAHEHALLILRHFQVIQDQRGCGSGWHEQSDWWQGELPPKRSRSRPSGAACSEAEAKRAAECRGTKMA